jgi:hypothetical protein
MLPRQGDQPLHLIYPLRPPAIPKFLGLGVQYFPSNVGRLLQQSSTAYLQAMRQAAADAGK